MRLVNGDVNVYYYHDTLTPENVRAASYGTESTSGALVPEVGDILRDFPGWTGEKYEPITVRVTEVKMFGDGVEAYEVRTATVPAVRGTWTYLLAFVSSRGPGSAVNTRPRPIDSQAEVDDVQAWIRNNGFAGALLTSFVLLNHDPDAVWENKGTTVTGRPAAT